MRLFGVGLLVAGGGAACRDRPLIVDGGEDGGGADVRPDLAVVPDGREDVMAGADAAGTTDAEPACRVRFTADPRNPFSPTGLPGCLDGADNDGDGFVDYADPDCTAFSDNDESSFAIRTATDEEDFFCSRDCYYDSNATTGDDSCIEHLLCDSMSPGAGRRCPYQPDAVCPAPSDGCRATCLPRTPNGCDCFGCCALVRDGIATTVLLSTTCDSQHLDDPTRCPPCTQQSSCLNPCETCEVCFGKPAPDPGCWQNQSPHDVAPPGQCAAGVTACGPGGVEPCACPADTYCVTGCCVPLH